MKSRHQVMVFMSLIMVWIGQFCCDVNGYQNVKVAVTARLLLLLFSIRLLFVEVCQFHFRSCEVQVVVGTHTCHIIFNAMRRSNATCRFFFIT